MTASEVQSIIQNSPAIGDNVYNFEPKYAQYKELFESVADESEIKDLKLRKMYKECEFLKTRPSIVEIVTTTHSRYRFDRYDFSNVNVESDNCFSLIDMINGKKFYQAADQILYIMEYNADESVVTTTGNTETNYNKSPRQDEFYDC